MKDEVFDIQLSYKRKPFTLTINADYPAGPQCPGCDYFVYWERKHVYTLNHCKNDDEIALLENQEKACKRA